MVHYPEGTATQSIAFENKDIVITDPCYIIKYKDKSRVGTTLSQCGIYDYATSTTYYGDWRCTVWQASSYEECTAANYIGEFCADAGFVCVADLNEVLDYNKEFKSWIDNHKHCATVIRNFTGKVEFILTAKRGLQLIGKNSNNIVWIAAQTGL